MFSPVVEASTIQQNFAPHIGTNPYVETAPKGCCIYVKTVAVPNRHLEAVPLALPAVQVVKLAAVLALALVPLAQRPKSGWIHRLDHLERQRG